MKTIYDLLTDKEKKLAKIIALKKDEILFHEDEKCNSICVVVKGEIVISSYSLSGSEIIYNTLFGGDVFGNNLLFSSSPFYKGNVLCKCKAEIALIDKESLLFILQNNSNFLEEYLKKQSNFSISLNTKLKILSFDSAQERLMYYLQIHNNRVVFTSVSNLAEKLFVKRETLSRLISSLCKKGIIKRKDNTIYVN